MHRFSVAGQQLTLISRFFIYIIYSCYENSYITIILHSLLKINKKTVFKIIVIANYPKRHLQANPSESFDLPPSFPSDTSHTLFAPAYTAQRAANQNRKQSSPPSYRKRRHRQAHQQCR